MVRSGSGGDGRCTCHGDNGYSNAHTSLWPHLMQSVSIGLPNWSYVQLLLRQLGLHAALFALLCASLFGANSVADSDANAYRM